MTEIASLTLPTRGPAEHTVRAQIVEAAEAHFSRYGYGKTTVSDLAKAIGFSKAYIYKFFDSKQAIGEAICAKTLSALIAAMEEAVAGAPTATEKFRRELVFQRSEAVRHRRARRRRGVAARPRLRATHQADADGDHPRGPRGRR